MFHLAVCRNIHSNILYVLITNPSRASFYGCIFMHMSIPGGFPFFNDVCRLCHRHRRRRRRRWLGDRQK